ncbi:hypothetical protein WJX84_001727 [Apatococcus fuscideae]|uniref:Uncharacterized protein n=1 Tax=Apatococcus fuscideae TaxID=2026836 RepID=A0AAW1T3Y1_9CHLO
MVRYALPWDQRGSSRKICSTACSSSSTLGTFGIRHRRGFRNISSSKGNKLSLAHERLVKQKARPSKERPATFACCSNKTLAFRQQAIQGQIDRPRLLYLPKANFNGCTRPLRSVNLPVEHRVKLLLDMASSQQQPTPALMRPLNGFRVIACLAVTMVHGALVLAVAGSPWLWYDILDRNKWANIISGAAFMFAMTTFMILTGLLAASSIIVQLEESQQGNDKVVRHYYAKRILRVVPAYYVALAFKEFVKDWPAKLTVTSILYRAAVVIGLNIPARVPILAITDTASHHPDSVAANWRFLNWLHGAFMTRVTEFGLGILIYLIVSSPKACAALRTRPWVCTTVSALTSAFIMSACIADADARPRPTEVSPLSARLGVHVVVLGVLAPLSTAWLILYTLVRPGLPATWAAAILGSNKWDWFAARTYSVFLLHPFVYFGVFQAVPVTAWIGPLDHFSTYATVLGGFAAETLRTSGGKGDGLMQGATATFCSVAVFLLSLSCLNATQIPGLDSLQAPAPGRGIPLAPAIAPGRTVTAPIQNGQTSAQVSNATGMTVNPAPSGPILSVGTLTNNATASQARKNTTLASPDYAGGSYMFNKSDTSANPNAAAMAASPAAAAAIQAAAANGAGSWAVVGDSGAIAIHTIFTPDNRILLMMRPDPTTPDNQLTVGPGEIEIAAIYDLKTNTYVPFHIQEHPFCSGHVVLPDGNPLIVGGDNIDLDGDFLTNGLKAVREYNYSTTSISNPIELPTGRWYPTLVTLPNGLILIVGGSQVEAGGYSPGCTSNVAGSFSDPSYDNPTFTMYDPAAETLTKDVPLQILSDAWPINLYPYLGLLPHTGSVLTIAGKAIQALQYKPTGATVDSSYGTFPTLPVPVSYPQTASFTMLTLEPPYYTPEVLIVGGSSTDCANAGTPASAASILLNASVGSNHSFVAEVMPVGRVMPDAVLLPTGDVFVCNGGQLGIAGGLPGSGESSIGATTGSLYNTSASVGSRWSTLADSMIPRYYHSSAFLTPNGTVWVAGSEPTVEYRVQIFTPAYLLNGMPRPVIGSAPGGINLGRNFTIIYTGTAGIDRVVIDKFTAVTHSIHMDQRQVRLACTDLKAGASVSCTAPPDYTISPAGYYMLFIVYQGVPSEAKIITVN